MMAMVSIMAKTVTKKETPIMTIISCHNQNWLVKNSLDDFDDDDVDDKQF